MKALIHYIRAQVKTGCYRFTLHADDERREDRLTKRDVEEALSDPELVEDYPDAPRGHSCLVLGNCSSGPVHVVVGNLEGKEPVLITVYRPNLDKWEPDWLTRRGELH